MRVQTKFYKNAGGHVLLDEKEILLNKSENSCVILRILYCGICNSDIKEVKGERISRRDFGHECLGIIIDKFDLEIAIGSFVVLDPHIQVNRDTCFAEAVKISGSKSNLKDALIVVPTMDVKWVLTEPLACSVHACKRLLSSNFNPKKILVYGAGFFGFLIYSYLTEKKKNTFISNRSEERIDIIETLTNKLNRFSLNEDVNEKFDAVVISQSFVSTEDIDLLLPYLKNNANILLFGAVHPGTSLNLFNIRNNELVENKRYKKKQIRLIGTLGANNRDFIEALDLLNSPPFENKICKIISSIVDIEQGHLLINKMSNGTLLFGKQIVRFAET